MLIPRKITGQSVWNTRAVAEISLRKSHRWLRISVTRNGSQNSLNFVTYSTCSSNSICHFRGKMTTFFKLADKVAAFQAKLDLWGRRMNRGIFDSIQTLAGISEETESEPSFTQVVHDHLSLLLKEFKFVISNHKRSTNCQGMDPRPICLQTGGKSTACMQEEEQLLETANEGGLWKQKVLKTLLSYLCEAGFLCGDGNRNKIA